MPKIAGSSAPEAQLPMTEVKETRTYAIPAPPPAPEAKGRGHRPSLTAWFIALSPEERADLWWYYLERLDDNIQITTEFYEGARGGKYLYRLTPQDINKLGEGAFEQELKDFIQDRFGGGKFRLLAVHKKFKNQMRVDLLEVDGQPKLTNREGFKDGRPALVGSEASAVLPQMIQMVRDEIRSVRNDQKNPGEAVEGVTQKFLEINQDWSRRLIDMMPKAPTATDQLELMAKQLELLSKLTGNTPGAANAAPIDPMTQFTQFATMLKTVRELDHPAQEPGSLKDIVREAVSTAVRETGAMRRGGTDYSWVLPVVEKLAPAGMALAQAWIAKIQAGGAAGGVRRIVQRAGAAVRGNPEQPPPAAPMPGAMPGTVAPPGSQPAASAPAEQAASADGGPIEITQEVADQILIEHAAAQILDLFKHDTPGDVVAGGIQCMFPKMAVLMRFMNEQQVTQFVGAHPILREAANDPRLPQFVAEFVGYFKESAEGEQA